MGILTIGVMGANNRIRRVRSSKPASMHCNPGRRSQRGVILLGITILIISSLTRSRYPQGDCEVAENRPRPFISSLVFHSLCVVSVWPMLAIYILSFQDLMASDLSDEVCPCSGSQGLSEHRHRDNRGCLQAVAEARLVSCANGRVSGFRRPAFRKSFRARHSCLHTQSRF